MPKIKKQEEIKDVMMSHEMTKNLKRTVFQWLEKHENDLGKFYIFVGAMKDKYTVLMYPNSEMEEYRGKFLKNKEYSIGDAFALDKCKRKSSGENGQKYDTGYFIPRLFWDKVINTQLPQ